MRKVAILTAVVSLVLASVTAAAAVTDTPLEEVMSGNIGALWAAADEGGETALPQTTTTAFEEAERAGAAPPSASTPVGNDTAAAASSAARSHLPDNDRARGLVYDGLRPGASDGVCPGGFEIDVDGATLCTHGPDPAPGGTNVRAPRSVAQLRLDTLSLPTVAAPAAVDNAAPDNGLPTPHDDADGTAHDDDATAEGDGSGTAAEAGVIPVIGDGTSGNRVLAVYAVASDRSDRYGDIAPLIANWAAHMDAMVEQSAALTGGERHVRFVTDDTGSLAVAKVVLPTDADDTFGNTINAMKAAGYDDPSRKYVIWMDASSYCGIANIYVDDRPTQDNANNGRFAQYARVDTGCWGNSNSVELHEVIHNMGAVQQSAPHTTPGWHCTDEHDRMCYKDSSGVTMTYTCDTWMEAYLDCGHDDYFHTAPPSGSYLASHWNVADSSFLHNGPVDGSPPPPPPPPPHEAPQVTATGPATVTLPDVAVLDGTVTDDGLPGPYTVLWSQVSGPGTVTFADETAEDTTATFSAAGDYVLQLTANDGELTGDDTVALTVEDPPAPPPDNTAPQVTAAGPATVTLPDVAVLDGTVTDDPPYAVLWSQVSGPGTVTFADETAEDTTATFSAAGDYVLRLTADDGELTGDDTVAITVEEEAAPPPPPDPQATTEVFEGSLNKKWTARTFETAVADGPADAVVTFGGRGKKAASVQLTVNVYDADEGLVATATGTSPIELTVTLAAGTYTWEVTGDRASFSLAVTYLAP